MPAHKRANQKRRGPRRFEDLPPCDASQAAAWFAGQLPDDWFISPVEVLVDRDEIIVTGTLAMPGQLPEGDDAAAVASESRITSWREATRQDRMAIADVAQVRWQRHVTWAARCGDNEVRFTSAAVPVMTRLLFDDRQVLDTLIDAGVARSRSEAMAWCVNQVGQNRSEWIDKLRTAMSEVERIRNEGS
ncbi:MAG: hypothetical protein ACN4GZ_05925 [Acidimicrobiales bacterium]